MIDLQKARDWRRHGLVVTISPDLRHTAQAAGAAVLNNALIDGTVIAPYSADFPYPLTNIGYLRAQGSPDTPAQRVYLHLSETQPAFLLLQSTLLDGGPLYDSSPDEDRADVLRRVSLFNRAAVTLLKEAQVEPRILHVVDWACAPSLLYLGEEKVPVRHTLFSYFDPRFQGLFADHLALHLRLAATSSRNDLSYAPGTISLAQAGLLRASRTVTLSHALQTDVINGEREDGGDWGNFQKLFAQLRKQRQLGFLYKGREAAERFMEIDLLRPEGDADKDFAYGSLLRYANTYSAVSPLADAARLPDEALFAAAERGKDFRPYHRFRLATNVLKDTTPDLVPAFQALIKGFNARAPLDLFASTGSVAARQGFFDSLRRLPAALNWYSFGRIARRALFGDARQFESLQAINPRPVLQATKEIKETGLTALRGDESSPYASLMIVTMSGGVGQRLRFATHISDDMLIRERNLLPAHKNALAEIEKRLKLNLSFSEKDGDRFWLIPQAQVTNEIDGVQSEMIGRTIKIPAQLFSTAANQTLTDAGVICGTDSKQDLIWTITAEQFQKLKPELTTLSDPFVGSLLASVEEKLDGTDLAIVSIPKGVYKLPGQEQSFFETQAGALAKLGQAIGKKIIWGLMLSADNEQAARQFLEAHLVDGRYFGLLDQDQVVFGTQENFPLVRVIDQETQAIDLCLNPASGEILTDACGHGGFYAVAHQLVSEQGPNIRYVLGCNIENPLFNFQLGNPDFVSAWLGQHVTDGNAVTGLSTAKARPEEKMGVFGLADFMPQVIEYNHPNFGAREAYAYARGKETFYFVQNPTGQVLIVTPEGLPHVFKEDSPPGTANVTDEIKKLRPGYSLLSLDQITADTDLFPTNDQLDFTGQTTQLAELGDDLRLKYRQGNTNIFLFDRGFIKLTVENPAVMAFEEHKTGGHRHGTKIESSIFGPLSLLRHLEALPEVEYINIGFVEEDRSFCFEPVKGPEDAAVALAALKKLQRQFPELA
ncbi:MAG: glycogen/starch synthase [bacterium]